MWNFKNIDIFIIRYVLPLKITYLIFKSLSQIVFDLCASNSLFNSVSTVQKRFSSSQLLKLHFSNWLRWLLVDIWPDHYKFFLYVLYTNIQSRASFLILSKIKFLQRPKILGKIQLFSKNGKFKFFSIVGHCAYNIF